MIATNPSHLLHTILTADQCAYWRLPPSTNLTSLLSDLEPTTFSPPNPQPWSHENVLFSLPLPPLHNDTVLYYIPSTVDNIYVIHLASKSHHTYSLLRSFTGIDHLQALGLAVLSSIRDFPTITSHFVHTPFFERTLTSLKPHRDSRLFQDIRNAFDSLHTDPDPSHTSLLTYSFYLFYGQAEGSPNQAQRRLWNQRFAASPHQTPPTPSLSPRARMWHNIKEAYIPFTHSSAIACQPPDNGQPVAAIRGAIKSHSRLITSTIIRLATGHCFDATYSQRFRPGADDPLTCPCSHSSTRPHLHTRHHVLFQCSHFTKERKRFITRPRRLPNILQSEVASERLGLFLKYSNCSLLRPLSSPIPINIISHTVTPPLNPEPP